jgi:hypothetical protein
MVLDTVNIWAESTIIDCNEKAVKVHFRNFSPKFDEWIPRDSSRIVPYTKTLISRKGMKQFSIPGQYNKENEASSTMSTQIRHHTRQITEFSDRHTHYINSLHRQGYEVVKVSGDGNCLFRAVSHQVYGTDEYHDIVRAKCMDYMEVNSTFFSQFVIGGAEQFRHYLEAKRTLGCWGDDPEIQAMSELYKRSAQIWAYDSVNGAKALRTFHESSDASSSGYGKIMRLSYYGGGHYDSVIELRPSGSSGPQSMNVAPGTWEDMVIAQSIRIINNAQDESVIEEAKSTSISEQEQIDRRALELAIAASRKDCALWESDDVEACLLLSASMGEKSTNTESEEKSNISSDLSSDVLATDVQKVTQRSEVEFIENALHESIVSESLRVADTQTSALLEEELLNQAKLASIQNCLSQVDGSMVMQNPLIGNVALPDGDDDSNLNLAIQLSKHANDEDFILRHTLQQSLLTSSSPGRVMSQAPRIVIEESDDDLQKALQLSMMAHAGNSTNNSNVYEDEQYDLELAIAASMSQR